MKSFAVIGLGRFGASLAMTLSEKGQQVIAIDKKETVVQEVMDSVTKAVSFDATDEKSVKAVGLHEVDVAVCAIGTDIEASILVTLMLKELGIGYILCKADSEQHKKVLEKIGADKVLLPEKDTGIRLAETLVSVSDRVLDHIGLYGSASILEIVPPDDFLGKTLRDLDMRSRFGVNVIAIKHDAVPDENGAQKEESKVNVNPLADDIVTKGNVLVVFGENEKIDSLKKKS